MAINFAQIGDDPMAPQTEQEIQDYYRNAEPGDLCVIRHTQHGSLEYELLPIDRFNDNKSRVYPANGPGYYTKSGKNCFHPTGQSNLRRPSVELLDWIASQGDPVGAHRNPARLKAHEARALMKMKP